MTPFPADCLLVWIFYQVFVDNTLTLKGRIPPGGGLKLGQCHQLPPQLAEKGAGTPIHLTVKQHPR
jgi:hypothetical protein